MFSIEQKWRSSAISTILGTALAMTAFAGQTANADITVVSQFSVSRTPAASAGQTSNRVAEATTYFQGDRSRTELPDGSVLIFDNDKNSLYQLNTETKTYRKGSIKDLEDIMSSLPAFTADRVSVDNSAHFKVKYGWQTYLGVPATRINVAGETRLNLHRSWPGGRDGFGFRRYRFDGGFDDDYDYQDVGYNGFGPERLPTYDISGDYWVSPTVTLPREKNSVALPLVLQMVWGGAPFVGDFVQQLDKSQTLPLHSELTVNQTYTALSGGVTAASLNRTVTTKFDVTSISNLPISPELFQIPADYKSDRAPVSVPQLRLAVSRQI